MPELPEVETTRLGIEPHVAGQKIRHIDVRQPKLRWPVPDAIASLVGCTVDNVSRRGKYLLLQAPPQTIIIHLGMSGSLRMADAAQPWRTHDHAAIELQSGQQLRYHDPRRFGCILLTREDPQAHKLLRHLGPEPLGNQFHAEHLFRQSRGCKRSVKNFIMDSQIVVGVGNIYASESLFAAGIRPGRAALRVTRHEYELLADAIRSILAAAIRQGGTTLRDFTNSDGNPGYFKQQLQVYGRTDEPCPRCETSIKKRVIGQRSSFYCPECQH